MAPDEMARIDLDPQLAERLIEGRANPADLPPAAAPVAAVLEATRRAATQGDDSQMASTIAAMRAVLVPDGQEGREASPVPVRRRVPLPLPKLVAAGTAGFAVLFGGLAAAGALPAAAQRPVADLAAHVGIELPRPASTDNTGEKPPEPTTSTTATTSTTLPAGDTTATTAPTSETTVTAPACPAPSYEGPNGCITPLPIPVTPTTSLAPPTTTTTTPPPPPTTTTSTTAPDTGGGGRGHGSTP
jgi:hypothetical protein